MSDNQKFKSKKVQVNNPSVARTVPETGKAGSKSIHRDTGVTVSEDGKKSIFRNASDPKNPSTRRGSKNKK